jgi:hypothetical protein
MALLTFDQISMEFQDGRAEKMCVFVLKNVTAGDTVNLNGYFKVVKRAVALSATDIHAGTIATINGTIITIPAGPTADAIWVMVIGVAA